MNFQLRCKSLSSVINYKHNPKMLPCLRYVYWARIEPINNQNKWLWEKSRSYIYLKYCSIKSLIQWLAQ